MVWFNGVRLVSIFGFPCLEIELVTSLHLVAIAETTLVCKDVLTASGFAVSFLGWTVLDSLPSLLNGRAK